MIITNGYGGIGLSLTWDLFLSIFVHLLILSYHLRAVLLSINKAYTCGENRDGLIFLLF